MSPRFIAFASSLAVATAVLHPWPVAAADRSTSYPYTTTSIYEQGTSTTTLYKQGCAAGTASSNGVVILDFGRPAQKGTIFGTIDFSGAFAADADILTATEQFAKGYRTCLPKGSSANIRIARGMNNSCSNEDPVCCPHGCGSEPGSFFNAGKNWAIWVDRLQSYIASNGWTAHESASAADDAEPAWDPPATTTDSFLAGFASMTKYSYPMWDFGSLEPGYWSSSQEYKVAYGYKPDVPFPEIYGSGNAQEWETLDRWAVANEGHPMRFWGVTSEYASGYSCGYTAHQAYDALLSELRSSADTYQTSIAYLTDIPCGSAFAVDVRTVGRGPSA